MRCSLDSIFKVGFGVDLNCLEEPSKAGSGFMKAFDDSSAQVFWRYIDPFWKFKRFLNIGSEASFRNNLKVIDAFVHRLISARRKLLHQPNLVSFISFSTISPLNISICKNFLLIFVFYVIKWLRTSLSQFDDWIWK